MVERASIPSPSRRRQAKAISSRRLLSVSGNGRGDYWHVAWTMAREEPLLGTGAGSFEAHWLRERPTSLSTPATRTTSTSRPSPSSVRSGWRYSSPRSRSRSRRFRRRAGLTLGPAAAGAFVAYLLHAGCRLGLGDARRDALRPLLRCRSARLATPGGLGSADGQPARVWRSRSGSAGARRSPSSGTSATEPRRPASPRSSVASPIVRSPTRSGRSTGRRGRTSPGSFAARPSSASRTTLRRARAWHTRSSSTLRIGVPWLDLAVASRGAERARALARGETTQPAEPGGRRA